MSDPRAGLKSAIKDALTKVAWLRLPWSHSFYRIIQVSQPLYIRSGFSELRTAPALNWCCAESVTDWPATLTQVYELEATVGEFDGNQELLAGRLNGLLGSLGALHACRNDAAFDVPVDLIR